MNPQCDGSHDGDEQQQHLLHSVSNKESIGGSSFLTPQTPPNTTTTITSSASNHYHNLLYPHGIFRIGLVLYDLPGVSKTDAMSIRAIANPASSCQLVAMTLIESSSLTNETTSTSDITENETQARQWLSQNVPMSFYDYCIPEVNNNIKDNNNNTNMHNVNSMSLNQATTPNATASATASTTALSASTMPLYFGIDGYHKMLQDDQQDQDDNDMKMNKIDAVYIIVPTRHQSTFVLQALRNNKHVLLNDPRSTSYETFLEQLQAARQNARFIQFSTMFVHHYRVQRFLDCVSYYSFGSGKVGGGDDNGDDDSIESMYALLTINVNDVDKLGGPTTTFPIIKPGDGCLRRLARYCVLIALLLMQQAPAPPLKNSKDKKNKDTNDDEDDDDDDDDCQVVLPISVQCTKATSTTSTCDDNGNNTSKEPIQASGIVKFAHGRTLTFDVAYSNAPTRQVLKVEGRHRYATMTDFVIPHPDGLSTYRVYDKMKTTTTTTAAADTTSNSTTAATDNDAAAATSAGNNNNAPRPWRHADLEIVKGQALDVPSGPPQDVMMWRRFASACRSVQQTKGSGSGSTAATAAAAAAAGGSSWDDDDDDCKKIANGRQAARNFTKVAMHLKRILKALDESYYNNFAEIVLDDISK